ncbi:transporter [Burkholderia stabilis]|uniref:Osmotically-inducible protein Y,periplasmic protein,Predicted periplasmic or secreted lipoprotein,BON domain n=1 Tax=Burkholderia stabilis TaxID=95485 RepID=A0AAJ5NCF6_9BURK|nr:BON domain-containing protein [Burkholderia stabilis]AOR71686.1 transporter [Burkholderia stabilis]VBB15869.1 Osmotically-inducible protein Y precursor,periplasmic protein,Predicted periplasmic or secreted lipoprotein,BON domain [Burkholderia stabilis]HDR9491650.1 BON domain-containing protein [Burkholderia stabilis]HDR9522271.1 BON domain-containing protein [Burkholderia stabilis]HDR9529520.1 BON domain-containing protein [Burkholderia stabilis]
MNKTPHLSTLLAVSAAFLLSAAPLTNAQAQTASADNGMAAESNQPVTDTWITTKVKSQLAATDGVKSFDIGVKTVDGVVTLTGVLPSKIAVKKAIAVSRAIKGVKHVDASGLKAKA